jgi:prepilin-type N-terminal cleavage/methylation domain-containing protein
MNISRKRAISSPLGIEQGFTLIEMLVVLTILGILAVVAVVSLHRPGFVDRGKVRAALAAAGATARLKAGSTGEPALLDLRRDELARLAFQAAPGFPDTAPTFYPDGSSSGGTFSLRGDTIAKLDWATGQIGDATQ